MKYLLVFACIILSVLLVAGCTEEDAYIYLQEHPDQITAYFAEHPDQINEYIAEHPEIMANITIPVTPEPLSTLVSAIETSIPETIEQPTSEITTVTTTEVITETVTPTTEVTTVPTTTMETTVPATEVTTIATTEIPTTVVTTIPTTVPTPEPTLSAFIDTHTGFPAIATIRNSWIASNPSQMISGQIQTMIGHDVTGMTGTGTYIVTTHSYIGVDGTSWSGSLPTTINMGFTWIDIGDGNYQIIGLTDPMHQNETEPRTAHYDQSSDTLTISGLSDTNMFVRG
jgi:hypothetical protein